MSNPMLATTNSNLDTRVKEPSGVVPPPSGVGPGSPDRFIVTEIKFKLDTQFVYVFCMNYIILISTLADFYIGNKEC